MRDFGGAFSRAVFGFAVGLAVATSGARAQEGDAAAPAEPIVIEIIGDAADRPAGDAAGTAPDSGDPEAISLAPWASESDAETADLAKAQDPSGDQFDALQPLASTNSSATGGSASAPGLGDSAPRESVDPFVGSFSTAVPIQLPPYHGIAPNLALTYNSSRGNGLAGVGWNLSGLSTIERASPGKGTPAYDATDIFLLDGQELVPCDVVTGSPGCDTGGTHTTEVESYLRIKQDATANTWELVGRDGTMTSYSAVMGSDTLTAVTTYRWAIASVEDTHANAVAYTWWCDETPAVQCYADTITYNGSTVEFHWEGRPDPVTFATGAATLGNTAFRLRSVDVKNGVDRVRAYALTYQASSAATGRSLLADVQLYGTDATLDVGGTVTGGTSLPKTAFDYASQAAGFAAGTAWSSDHAGTAYDGSQVTYADVTGDARADMIFHKSDNTIWVSVATTSGFSARSQWAAPGGTHKPDQASFADVDGDGKSDLVFRKSNNEIGVYLSNGSGFTVPTSWSALGGDYLSGQALFSDVDGDGRADLVFRAVDTNCVTTTVSRHCGRLCSASEISTLYCPSGYDHINTWFTSEVTHCGSDGETCREEIVYKDCRQCNDTQSLKVGISTGSGFAPATTWISDFAGDYQPDQAKLGDLNGDGKTDFVFRTNSNTLKIALSTGVDFGPLTDWASFGGQYYAGQAQLADLNGDGKSDIVFRTVSTGCSNFNVTQYYCGNAPVCPTGTTVVGNTGCVSSEQNNGDTEYNWTLTCQSCSGSGVDFKVVLSTGSGFTAPESWLADSGAYSSGQAKYADVNGDGRADLIFQTSTNEMRVSLSTGSGFANPAVWATPGGTYDDSQALYADVDGDGRTDFLFRESNQTVTAYLGTPSGAPTDGLTSVTNPLGGTTTVAYTPSSAWTNQNLPMVLQTVSAITSDDGRGNTSTTAYAYEGGLWNQAERRFLGFRKATVTLPCIAGETVCPYTESTFRQDLASAGRVEQVDRFDGAGTLLTRSLEEYVVNDTVAPYTALNTASESQIIVGTVTRRTRVTRSFDDYANVVEETGHGDADILGDEITAATDYAPNTTDYIVGLPARMRSFEGTDTTGTLLTESQVHYDGATSWMTPPVRGDPTESRDWLDTEARFVASQAEYDTFGNVTATIDPLGRRSEIDYDSVYHLYPVAARNPLYFPPASDTRHQTSTVWDTVCGVPTSSTDLNGNTTTTAYDALCRPTRTDLPDGGFAITSYNAIGDPTAQYIETQTPPADGSGNIWSRTYMDGFGRPYRSTAKGPAVGQEILADTAYNLRGGVASQTAPYYTGDPVHTTTLDYDALNRPTGATHPDGNWTETAYGVEGVFLSTTSHDELGHPITLHLDAFGRALRKTEPLDLSTTITTDYAYDTLGRLTGITDDVGNTWAYSFDSFGRTLTVDDPDLGLWSKSYDDAGQLLTQTDALAQVTRFTYDLLGRMLTKTARDGTAQAELTSYTYDQAVAGFHNVGALTRAENPAGVLQYRYDPMGREAQRVYTLDGTDYAIASGFDIAGRLLWQDYPDGDAVGSALDPITYDTAGRLATIPGLVTAASYDASGNAETFTRANGVVSTYGYSDQRGWLDSLTTMSGATSIQALTYTRDDAGQITAVASTHADESWGYGYDALRRLLSATNTDTPAYNRTYTYDTIGNMLSNSGIAGSYSYPTPTSPRPHAVTAIGGWTYTYDANGNMTAGAGRSFTYNGENRPTQIDTQAYTYGPDGERWKTVDTSPGGGTTLYLGGTIEIAAGTMTKYLPGNAKRVGSPGDPLVETFWLHHDHQGSIQAITDAAGVEVQRFLYYPYGDRIATATAHDESKGWIGERQDATGLFYLHARYYDPVIGRFNSADPSDPMAPGAGLNRYAYAGNSPIMRIDPWGLKFVGNDESGGGGTKIKSSRYGERSPNEYRRNQRRPSISAPMRAQGYVYDSQIGEYVLPRKTPHAAVETATAVVGFGFDWAAIEAIFGGAVATISAPVIGGLAFTGAILYSPPAGEGSDRPFAAMEIYAANAQGYADRIFAAFTAAQAENHRRIAVLISLAPGDLFSHPRIVINVAASTTEVLTGPQNALALSFGIQKIGPARAELHAEDKLLNYASRNQYSPIAIAVAGGPFCPTCRARIETPPLYGAVIGDRTAVFF